MKQLLVRELKPGAVERLKDMAKRNHRSLEAEARLILESAAERDERWHQAVRAAAEMRRALAGKITEDSADLIREDRER